jgi:hypothetical protein
MKGFDVWKLLGGRAPRGYRGAGKFEKAAKEAMDELGKKDVRTASLGDLKYGSSSKAPPKGNVGGDLATLAFTAGIPLATLYAAYKGTKREREGQQ